MSPFLFGFVSVLLVLAFWSAESACGGVPLPLNARSLSDFTNNDGSRPDGKDDLNDDTSAIQKALAAGPGVVYIGPGFYRWSEVSIPAKVTVVGAGPATVLRPHGAKSIFVQENLTEWGIRDLVLDGQAQGPWRNRKDEGLSGIRINKCADFTLSNITVKDFSGPGLQMTYTLAPAEGWSSPTTLDSITATGNYIGIRFDKRAEYMNATKLTCRHNVIGCVIHAGNAKIAASNFTTNIDGLLIEDKENGSHGAISNCLINHNERYALLARNAAYGMAIDNCCLFCGTIRLENCTGFNITSGIINATMEIAGKTANRIAGNYIIPEKCTFTFAPATIVQDNFTETGPWEKNTNKK
jgi:hypothetical protein